MNREQVQKVINEVNGGKVIPDHRGVYSVRLTPDGEYLACGKFGDAYDVAKRLINLGLEKVSVCLEGVSEYWVTAERVMEYGALNEMLLAALHEAEQALDLAIDDLVQRQVQLKDDLREKEFDRTAETWRLIKQAYERLVAEYERLKVSRVLWANEVQ